MENKTILMSKILESNLPQGADVENANKVHFTENGGLYIYKEDGEQVQVGCSRKEFEEIKDMSGSALQWSAMEW